MIENWIILLTSFAYLGLLFAIAWYGDKRASQNRSIISNPYIYALSLAVYCTAWTFYGSVGRAVDSGVGFLPIYIGPTLMALLWWGLLRKIIRISKRNRITSIADFISSRYGKSTIISGVVTVIAVIGIVPYISLQLKAISSSFQIISAQPELALPRQLNPTEVSQVTTFYIAMILAFFTIVFGTRHLDATERHEGMVAAVAFESVVKLLTFLVVGVFVTFFMFDGFADLFRHADTIPELHRLMTFNSDSIQPLDWFWLILLSMMAILFLPRQFQLAVIENVDERHVRKAIWLFPLYLFVINIFVLPIAFGGVMTFGSGGDADTFVLSLPLAENQAILALMVFVGGLSAATSMVIVETIALSTMICNDLVMPILLRLSFLKLDRRKELTGLLLGIRRSSIILVMVAAYIYFYYIGEFLPLVSIGLMSFAAVAQFAPAIIGGIYWKEGSHLGALTGMIVGFLVWAYTLPIASLAEVGALPDSFIANGLFGIEALRPYQLFGLTALQPIGHSLFWSLLLNAGCYVGLSLLFQRPGIEHTQASRFVDVFRHDEEETEVSATWRGTASPADLYQLLRRFMGKRRADHAFTQYAEKRNINVSQVLEADADFVHFIERLLAGTVGSATARAMVATVVKEEPLSVEEVMSILDETQQVIAYSRELEKKSQQLEAASAELKAANQRLQELDRLKDDFVSTVTHELRTPLTSVRAFSEILHDNPDLDLAQRQHFLGIIIKESERLTRLINQLLDLQKIESDALDWQMSDIDIREVIRDAAAATSQLMTEKQIALEMEMGEEPVVIRGDRDRLVQVMLNLLSNAIKFTDSEGGRIYLQLSERDGEVQIDVRDNGIGIKREDQELIFQKFRQVQDPVSGRPGGSGLGLPITKRIIEYHQGRIWVKSKANKGATFSFTLPLTVSAAATRRD